MSRTPRPSPGAAAVVPPIVAFTPNPGPPANRTTTSGPSGGATPNETRVTAAGATGSRSAAAAEPPTDTIRDGPSRPDPGADDAEGAGPAEPAPAPASLPVIDYGPAPAGFPADPTPLSTAHLSEGLRPLRVLVAYDAPGGRAVARLAPTIRGVPLTMPVVRRLPGWTAVLLPSANRRLAWLPPGPWRITPLPDQLVVIRGQHRMTWLRNGRPIRSWRISLGAPDTPTPLGRTFVLGRSTPGDPVYGGTDVFALGALPENPTALPPGLRGAHIGIHTWHHDRDLGRDVTDGCVRLHRAGQRELLAALTPGTTVVVLDRAPAERAPVKE